MLAYRRIIVTMLTVALLLSGCGGSPPAEPTVAPLVRPSATPRPVATKAAPTPKPAPTDAPAPTEEPTAKTLISNEPTSVPGTGGTLATVEIDGLETYTHPDGLFSLDVPSNWTRDDQSDADKAAVTWSDPTNNALIVALVREAPEKLTQEQMAEQLQQFVDTYKDEPEFNADPPENLDNGVQIIWGYDATADGGVVARLLANSFMYQFDNKLAMLMLLVPNDQFDGLKGSLDDILNSFNVDSSVSLGTAAAPDDNLPDGTLYDFSSDDGTWPTESTDKVEAIIDNGVYTLRVIEPDQYYIVNPDMEIGSEQGVAATVEPSGDARAGIFLRLRKESGKSSFYACWIDANSQYGCFVSDKGDWKTLQDATESSSIKAGKPNRLRMTMVGEDLSFSVNGIELVTLSDSTLSEGRAGLYAENFSDPVEATFDDVLLSSK